MSECKILDVINGKFTIGGSSGDASFLHLNGKPTTSRNVKDAVEHAVSRHDSLVDQLTNITKQRDALLKELCDIQSSCIGEITMGYKLDAESIGASISKATGMTHPEIVSALDKGNTNPSAYWMSKLFSIVSRYNDFTKGWESWDDWGSYFNDGLSPQEAYAESMRTI